jgi:chromosome segregation ATPase
MVAVNEKLKEELLDVINKMDSQIRKFEDKRRARIENELKTNAALQDKDLKIKKQSRKHIRLKQEISDMWQALESQYSVGAISKLEDELKDKTKRLQKLKQEAEAMEKVSKDQNQALEQMGGRNKENSEKLYQLNNQMREVKQETKTLRDQHREDEK